MKYRQLGRSGLRVSELCLGAMTFGEADENSFMHKVGCDEETSRAIMNRALDAGLNFIDTADVYGQDGLSERVIGSWFERDRRRDEVVLATKFRFTMGEGPNRSGASRYRIVRCCEDSLRRLKTDRIDLYQIHCQDLATPEEETLRALDDLVRQGKVLYIGASNYAGYRLVDSLWTSRAQGLEAFTSLQASYSLMVRDLERELVPVCRERGLGILPYSPLAGGFLTGKYRKGQEPPAGTRLEKWRDRLARFDQPRSWRILEALDRVAAETGATVASVALAWLLTRPAVTSVIFGARSTEQLDENLRAVEVELSTEQVAALDEASAFEPGYPYEFIARVSGGRW
ncbi:MAG TPA: aldo/keto reductase [Kofleriaceae bacterium]|nr:aldo/keto reductase [Kofleriaceae bacterium]